MRVSVVDGGFAAVHDLIKAGRISLRGDAGDATLRRIAVIEHAPRRCPPCRHTAHGRALLKQGQGHEDEGATSSSLSSLASGAAATAQRNVAGALRSLLQRSYRGVGKGGGRRRGRPRSCPRARPRPLVIREADRVSTLPPSGSALPAPV